MRYQAILETQAAGGQWTRMASCLHDHRTETGAERCARKWERLDHRVNHGFIAAGLMAQGTHRYTVQCIGAAGIMPALCLPPKGGAM